MEVTKQYRAEIAHRLPRHPGGCRFIHGHSYLFEVTVEGEINDADGMVVDFKNLKSDIEQVIGPWDHSLILWEGDVELCYLLSNTGCVRLHVVEYIPTAENMAQDIAERLERLDLGYIVSRVKVWETSTSYAEWSRKGGCQC